MKGATTIGDFSFQLATCTSADGRDVARLLGPMKSTAAPRIAVSMGIMRARGGASFRATVGGVGEGVRRHHSTMPASSMA